MARLPELLARRQTWELLLFFTRCDDSPLPPEYLEFDPQQTAQGIAAIRLADGIIFYVTTTEFDPTL